MSDNHLTVGILAHVDAEEADAMISDALAMQNAKYENGAGRGKQEIINIGVINEYFAANDVITLATLKQKGLINEDANLKREVETCLHKLWGAGRIRAHLYSRGFDTATLSQLDELLEEVDTVENCVVLIRKHYVRLPDEGDERRRLIAFLGRYGYSLGEIRSAFAKMQEQ